MAVPNPPAVRSFASHVRPPLPSIIVLCADVGVKNYFNIFYNTNESDMINSMPISLVNAEEPSAELAKSKPKQASVLPKEESYRLRRRVRSMADQLSPWALNTLVKMAQESDDPKFIRLVCLDVLNITTSRKSNEDVDPEGPVVDSTATKAEDEALATLETSTEEGTGDSE